MYRNPQANHSFSGKKETSSLNDELHNTITKSPSIILLDLISFTIESNICLLEHPAIAQFSTSIDKISDKCFGHENSFLYAFLSSDLRKVFSIILFTPTPSVQLSP